MMYNICYVIHHNILLRRLSIYNVYEVGKHGRKTYYKQKEFKR